MRIVHELNQLEYGGSERIVRNIVAYDEENEHTVVTYKDGTFRKELEAVDIKVILPPENNEEIDMEADIIHVHTGGARSQLGMSLGNRFPVIETIHSPVRSPMPSELIKQRVGVSNVVTSKNQNCITILNGVDFEWLDKTSEIINGKELLTEKNLPNLSNVEINNFPVVGRLGRLGKDKGCEDWLLTCYELQQQGYDFISLIVGSGGKNNNGYVEKLKLMTASLPVKNVVWAGHRNDILRCMHSIDVFLYPSLYEGFGLVFTEAMYGGCTVVSYKTDVTKELFEGYAILTEQTIPALIEGVKKGFKAEYQDAYSGISKDWVYSEYNANRMSKEYQKLYKEVYERSN